MLMKTLQIQTSKADLLLVELPENVKKPFIYKWLQYRYLNDADLIGFTLDLENDSDYEILGFLDSLSEEQKESVCELHSITRTGVYGWKDYKRSPEKEIWYTLTTASESFQSLLDIYNVTRVNALGEKPKFDYGFPPDGPSDSLLESAEEHYARAIQDWQSAEQLTFKNPLILIRYK